MAVVPRWVIGRRVTGLSIIPQTEGADGTLSAGTTASLTGKLDSVRISSNPETAEISAMDAARQSNTILKEATTITVTEILQATGASTDNALATFATAYDVGQFTLIRAGKTWTFYGRRGEYNESIDKGRATGVLTLSMIDPTASNPTLA